MMVSELNPQSEEGGYDVIIPAIPEICTFGDTLEEAKRMAKDAIKCYLESAIKRGEPIPEDRYPSIERVDKLLMDSIPALKPQQVIRALRDVPKGTLRRILRQAGLTVEEFMKLL